MATVKLIGLDKVIANLNKEIAKIKGASMAGLWDVGLQVQASSQKRCPVDTGNLKASHYTRRGMMDQRLKPTLVRLDESHKFTMPNGRPPSETVEIGATAEYAMSVHENMEANYRVGGPKFLERAIADNQSRILQIIKARASV